MQEIDFVNFKANVAHCISDPLKHWYAVYTVVRHEKAVNTKLKEKGIETFLPVRVVMSRWKDRINKIQAPLFPGYLFTRINLSTERFEVLRSPGVVRILGIGDNPTPVPADQINNICILLASHERYEPDEYNQQGKKVVVVRGSLSGIHGEIIERRGIYRLILSVDMIQRSLVTEVDIRDVELL